jgi:hypothetical protein
MSKANQWAWGAVTVTALEGAAECNASQGNAFTVTLNAASVEISMVGIKPGQPYSLTIVQDGTGGRVAVLGSGFAAAGQLIIGVEPGDQTVFAFMGASYTEVDGGRGGIVVASGTVISSAEDEQIILRPGVDSAAGGANKLESIQVYGGKIHSAGPFAGYGAQLYYEHPDVGTLWSLTATGTAGTPDTGVTARFDFGSGRIENFDPAGDDYWIATANNRKLIDLDATSYWRWRDAATPLNIAMQVSQDGVAFGAATEADQNGCVKIRSSDGPTGNPEADCVYLWWNEVSQVLFVRWADGTDKELAYAP